MLMVTPLPAPCTTIIWASLAERRHSQIIYYYGLSVGGSKAVAQHDRICNKATSVGGRRVERLPAMILAPGPHQKNSNRNSKWFYVSAFRSLIPFFLFSLHNQVKITLLFMVKREDGTKGGARKGARAQKRKSSRLFGVFVCGLCYTCVWLLGWVEWSDVCDV